MVYAKRIASKLGELLLTLFLASLIVFFSRFIVLGKRSAFSFGGASRVRKR